MRKRWRYSAAALVLAVSLAMGSGLPVRATEASDPTAEGTADPSAEAPQTEQTETPSTAAPQPESTSDTAPETTAQAAPEPTTNGVLHEATNQLGEINSELNQIGSELGELGEGLGSAMENHNTIQQKKTDADKMLDSLNSQYSSLSTKVSRVEAQIADKETAIADKEAEIARKEAEIAAKKQEIEEMVTAIGVKETEIARTEENLAGQYEAMKLRIQYMYENASPGQYLEMLLSSDGLIDFLNRVEYLSAMMEYDSEKRTEYADTLASLNQQKLDLDAQKAELDDQRAQLEDEEASLEEDYATLKSEKTDLDSLRKSLKNQQAAVSSQQAATSKELQAYIDQLVESSGTISSYEEKIAAKTQYYEDLLAQKEAVEALIAREKAEEAANSSSGNITQENSGIDHNMTVSASADEYTLLASIIYCEAGGESYEGKLAVGYVIMNRVRSSKFPNTITDVVYQKNQFSPVASGRLATILAMEADPEVKGKVTDSCYQAATEVLTGTSNVDECLFFRTWAPVPQLITNLENNGVTYFIIGNHIFYYSWVAY